MNAVHPSSFASLARVSSRSKATQAVEPQSTLRQTVIFDLDGTLVDTAPDLTASLNHCLSRAGIAWATLQAVRPHAGRGAQAMLREAYRAAGRPLDEHELAHQTACFLTHYADHIAVSSTVYPGAIEAMDRLEASGAILAVCTNKTEMLARRLLAALNLADRFAAICGADTFPARKPDPAHLLGTIALAGGDRRCAVMIGDTDTDMEAAARIGIPSILVEFGYDPDLPARAKASRTLRSYAELGSETIYELLDRPSMRRATA